MTAYGLGLEGSRAFGERLLTDVKVQHKERRFRDSNTRTTNSRQDGGESLLKVGGRYAISNEDLISGSLSAKTTTAADKYQGSFEYAASLGYSKNYLGPVLPQDNGPWTTSMTLSRSHTQYKGYDTAVDPNNRRHDKKWTLDMLTSMPLYNDWTMILNLQKVWAASSLLNYKFRNEIASVGISTKF